jgi:phosphoglycerate dehydrogenase-like enzyme
MAIEVWMRDGEQREAVGPLPEGVRLHVIPRNSPPPAEIIDAEFLVPPQDAAVLEMLPRMPRLAVVQTISAGTDWLLRWVPREATLCNARGIRDTAVAEWVLAVILALEKRLAVFAREQAHHRWRPEPLGELAGKRALIVGYGSVGQSVGRRLSALGVEVAGVAATARRGVHGVQALPELLGSAEVVVLVLPLTDRTRHLFDGGMLARMRPGALLVNAARGAVIDTPALLEALAAGRIRAALDVTDPEPLPPDHPLWDAPGVLITPHLAGDSPQAEARAYRFVGEQIGRYARGEPLQNVVRPGSGPV